MSSNLLQPEKGFVNWDRAYCSGIERTHMWEHEPYTSSPQYIRTLCVYLHSPILWPGWCFVSNYHLLMQTHSWFNFDFFSEQYQMLCNCGRRTCVSGWWPFFTMVLHIFYTMIANAQSDVPTNLQIHKKTQTLVKIVHLVYQHVMYQRHRLVSIVK